MQQEICWKLRGNERRNSDQGRDRDRRCDENPAAGKPRDFHQVGCFSQELGFQLKWNSSLDLPFQFQVELGEFIVEFLKFPEFEVDLEPKTVGDSIAGGNCKPNEHEWIRNLVLFGIHHIAP